MSTNLFQAFLETIAMVLASSLAAVILGLPLGVAIFATKPKQFWENKLIHFSLSFLVNIGRSIPFIILMIAIIPLTRLITGTSIGMVAAMVPLSLAATPFFARIVELALLEVPYGLIETGYALGATPLQIISKILIPESLASILAGLTLTIINLIGYSAMAGAIGGGGLGTLAYNYGYLRFDTPLMLSTLVILIILVQIIQGIGDYAVNKIFRR
ncbi:MAG: methionine ABC transporter permease [Gammaproteobacteria bacterium]